MLSQVRASLWFGLGFALAVFFLSGAAHAQDVGQFRVSARASSLPLPTAFFSSASGACAWLFDQDAAAVASPSTGAWAAYSVSGGGGSCVALGSDGSSSVVLGSVAAGVGAASPSSPASEGSVQGVAASTESLRQSVNSVYVACLGIVLGLGILCGGQR